MKYSNEDFDKTKTKILKYVLYKKRTEQEIRLKFSKEDTEILNDAIDYLKEVGYINDDKYISRAVTEYMALRNLSIKEIKYKLLSKGIEKDRISDYIYTHKEELQDYELHAIKNIVIKKSNQQEDEELINFLLKKGFEIDLIKEALDER